MNPAAYRAAPPRLIDGTDAAAHLLADVAAEELSASQGVRAWDRLEQALDQPKVRLVHSPWAIAAGTLAGVVAVLLAAQIPGGWVRWAGLMAPDPAVELAAEPVAARPMPKLPVPSAEPRAVAPPAAKAVRVAPPRASASTTPQEDCLALLRSGRHDRALGCYEAQAAGSGMTAELAQYELGRLRRNLRGDTSGALAAYQAYLKRFPGGALRTEAAVSAVELLFASGRSGEALAESDRMLASGAARERTAELRLLRGRTFQKAGDCARARAEYQQIVTAAGRVGEQARAGMAACDGLEQPTPEGEVTDHVPQDP